MSKNESINKTGILALKEELEKQLDGLAAVQRVIYYTKIQGHYGPIEERVQAINKYKMLEIENEILYLEELLK